MSRNSERVTLEPTPVVEPPISTEQKLTFNIPTSFVKLPSLGKFYPVDHPLYNQEVIEIKHMTTKEEEILNSQSLIQRGLAIDRLLQSVLVDKTIKSDSLLLGDKNAILMAARIDAYGEDYDVSITCPGCGDRNEVTVPLSSFDSKEMEFIKNGEVNENGNVLLTLPRTGAVVEIKFLTIKDEATISQFAKKNKKLGIEKLLSLQYKQMIVSVNGDESLLTISQFIGAMPAFDSRYLRTTYNELSPNMDLGFNFSCQYCGAEQHMEVPITVNFFWPQ